MTTNQILTGVGLILALAVGSQILASRLRIPAIIVLLPAGFIAGALTTDVDPQRLPGPASATVTPASLRHLLLPTLALVAVMVLVARPIVAFASTLRTDLARGERAFIGWMAPRGIVAAATASTFAAGLEVVMWAGLDQQRERIRRAGLELAPGELTPVTQTSTPTPQPGDTLVSLGPALAAQPADPGHRDLPEVERR